MDNSKNTLIQITNNGMGQGDPTLGLTLITNYFKILLNDDRLPKMVVFYNSGVKLLTNTSPAIDSLKEMANKGVTLLACKTCLDFFNLTTEIEVGNIGTMMDIITLQANADKVITI